MSLLAFLVACGAGAALGLGIRPSGRNGRLAVVAGLLVALVAALLIGSTTRVTIGDVVLAGSVYSGLFLACAAASGLLLAVVALASGWSDELVPATLASLAGLAVATTATDSGVALASGAAAATAGALVMVGATPRSPEADGRLAEIRTIGLVAAALLFAAMAILRPPWTGKSDSPVFVLAFFGLGLALAVRSGAVPFHVPAARLRETASPLAPALLLVWIPAGLGLLAISWSATTSGIRSDWLSFAIALLQVLAVATLVLGALAALVHDELEEVAAYSIVADAGFVLLALAARTDAASEPARLWLLAFVVAKTGLVAWAAAVSRAFGTSNLFRLRGWLRRTPLLGLALVAIAVATLGWPGSAVYGARSALMRLALPGQLQFLFAGSILLSLAYYGRLLLVGVLSPTEEVRAARGEWPRWTVGRSFSNVHPDAEPTSPAESPTTAGATDVESVSARRKPRGSRAAAAALSTATTTNATRGTPLRAGKGVVAGKGVDTEAASGSTPTATPAVEPEAGPDFRRKLAVAWTLNRTLEVSLVVVSGAALAVVVAFGGLGATNASRFGIPLDTAAHATPRPTPTPPPTPTLEPTPEPSLAPRPTAGPSGSASPNGSTPPTSSPGPVKTSAPARRTTD